ncbi:hypothetical protein ACVV2G_18975 [Streptomyces ziwulingensis]
MNVPHRVAPRRLGAAAAVYGVFVAGWYLGRPVTPECRVDRAAPAGSPRSGENLDLDYGLLRLADDMDGYRDGEYGPGDYGYGLRGGPGENATSGGLHATRSYRKRARLLAWVNGYWG